MVTDLSLDITSSLEPAVAAKSWLPLTASVLVAEISPAAILVILSPPISRPSAVVVSSVSLAPSFNFTELNSGDLAMPINT